MATKKIGLVVTHSADQPELATLPFILATGAMAMGVEPLIFLQGEGVRLALPGGAESAAAEGFAPLGDLMGAVLSAGHRIMACSPCLGSRGITEDQLIEGCYVGGAAIVVEAMLECENFLRY
jgi:predicted peroxiredoxin